MTTVIQKNTIHFNERNVFFAVCYLEDSKPYIKNYFRRQIFFDAITEALGCVVYNIFTFNAAIGTIQFF